MKLKFFSFETKSLWRRFAEVFVFLFLAGGFFLAHNFFGGLEGQRAFLAAVFFLAFFGALLIDIVLLIALIAALARKS